MTDLLKKEEYVSVETEQLSRQENEHLEQNKLEYAGFWTRFFALLIDTAVVVMIMMILSRITVGLLSALNVQDAVISVIDLVVLLVAGFSYFILLPASEKQGTLGKQICEIYIGDENGNRITVKQSVIRYLSTYLSNILYVGYILVAYDEKKRGLHDFIAKTYVFKSNKQE